MEALHDQVLADTGFLNHQIVHIQVVVVFGIGDGRLQGLLDHAGNALLRKGELVESTVHFLAADLLRHQVQLAGRDADVAGNRHRLMVAKHARARFFTH